MTIATLANSLSTLGAFTAAERTAFNAGLNLAIAAVNAWERDGGRDLQDLLDALSDMRFL